MPSVMPFGEVLDAAVHLSSDEQREWIPILNHRLAHSNRQRIAAEVWEARQEFAAGRCWPASPAELLRDRQR